MYPVWAPDGRRLIWASQRMGPFNVYSQPADGTGTAERLAESPNIQLPTAITPDGAGAIVRMDGRPGGGVDLMLVPLDGKSSATELAAAPATERNGDLSPDARWLAYESDESGRFEVYVRPFPDVEAGKWQVSTGGGTRPIWARTGRELFYRGPDGAVFGVAAEPEGMRFRAGEPVKLVEGRYFGVSGTFQGRTYDVAPDGSRFLMIREAHAPTDAAGGPAIIVVQNWVEELKRRMPGR